MKIRIGVIALSLVLFASAGAAAGAAVETAQSEPAVESDSETTPPSDKSKGWEQKAGPKCRSQADDKAIAVELCEAQLDCSNLSPSQTTSCSGQPGRWICQCK